MPEPIGKSSSDPGALACTDAGEAVSESKPIPEQTSEPSPETLVCSVTAGAADLIDRQTSGAAAKLQHADTRRGIVLTVGRENFDGTSTAVFGEGGWLGRVGVEVTSASFGAGVGFGRGAAGGAAVTTTTTEPIYSIESGLQAMSPFRRGP